MDNKIFEIRKIVVSTLKEYDEKIEIDENVSLKKDLCEIGMDSLAVIMIIVKIEEFYNIEIPDDLLTLENFSSILKIYGCIMQCKNRSRRR